MVEIQPIFVVILGMVGFGGVPTFPAWPLRPFRAALIRGSTLALKNAPSEAPATTHNSDRTCHWGLKN